MAYKQLVHSQTDTGNVASRVTMRCLEHRFWNILLNR